jgi:hypothetical protein
MKAQWKSVVYRDEGGEEVIETFPTNVLHADYAARRNIPKARLIAAGFATADRECFGSSTSLGLDSRTRRDTALLRGED